LLWENERNHREEYCQGNKKAKRNREVAIQMKKDADEVLLAINQLTEKRDTA
jgi:hypothetical protein